MKYKPGSAPKIFYKKNLSFMDRIDAIELYFMVKTLLFDSFLHRQLFPEYTLKGTSKTDFPAIRPLFFL